MTDYKPNHITYTSNSTSDQLAVFSEVWYGPNKGWQAYIDGKPVDNIRANYILRGLKIPAGQHMVEFKFSPKSYAIGSIISLICSLLILAGLIGFIYFQYKNNNSSPMESVVKKEKKTRIKPTKSKRNKKGKK